MTDIHQNKINSLRNKLSKTINMLSDIDNIPLFPLENDSNYIFLHKGEKFAVPNDLLDEESLNNGIEIHYLPKTIIVEKKNNKYSLRDSENKPLRIRDIGYLKDNKIVLLNYAVCIDKNLYQEYTKDQNKYVAEQIQDIQLTTDDIEQFSEFYIKHEEHHFLNSLKNKAIDQKRIEQNKPKTNLDIEEKIKEKKHDEISSILEEILHGRKIFKSQDNKEDISMFEEHAFLYKILYNVNRLNERDAILDDLSFIVNGNQEQWEQDFIKSNYSKDGGQFDILMQKYIRETPVQDIRGDKAEYYKRRSAMYTFNIDGQTKDLSKLIKRDVKVPQNLINKGNDLVEEKEIQSLQNQNKYMAHLR